MRSLLTSLISLALFTVVISAQDAIDIASLDCRRANKDIYASTSGACKCDVSATELSAGGWTKCPPPTGEPDLGLPSCTKSTGSPATCGFYCTQDATKTATGCLRYKPADEPGVTKDFQSTCDVSSPGTHIAARPTGGCTCGVIEFIATDGYEDCVAAAPANSKPTCLYNDEKIGRARCSFECNPGFKLDATACVVDTPTPPGPTPNNTTTDDFAKDCSSDFPFSFASPTDVCKCYRKASLAKSAPPPSGHGKAGCKNVGPKESKCGIICDTPAYKLSTDGLDCVLAVKDKEMKEDECAEQDGGGQYMSAVPGQGCVCLSAPGPYWCKPATPDIGSPICSDKTTAAKGRVIECTIGDCPTGFTSKGTHCEQDEGAFGTISSVTKCKVPSTIYALPAKAGCSCVAAGDAVPTGAKKCGDGYATCTYLNKTPRVPAACGSNCNPGFVKPDGATDCEAE
ncbi:hypothetical protein B0H10DRAFT_2436264 [Mycena sp. CBHHK59/15]|nr:hypothetical protein B0H10DRAFT_2436264 [Mycena sp. CBHHK59/15]